MSEASEDPATRRLVALLEPASGQVERGSRIGAAAALLWLPQAGLVAWLVSHLLHGTGRIELSLLAAGGFAVLGIARAGLQEIADRDLAEAADAVLERERRALVVREGRRSPFAAGAGSAEVAALAVEKLAALAPYVTRYRPAQLRVAVVPPVILAASLAVSWIVALILLVAGPLIPMFMALVGMAARDASERQMDEIGGLNALLMERLQALVDIRLLDARAGMIDQFERRAASLRESTIAVLRIAFLSSTVLELFAALGVAMVAVYVGFALLGAIGFGAWKAPLTAGEGIFLLLLAPEYFRPLRDLAGAWHDRAAASAVARDLVALESVPPVTMPGLAHPATHGTPPPVRARPGRAEDALVIVRRLELEVAPGETLGFPDLLVRRGESIALVGPSGAGKSMLLAALAGLLPAADGDILVDGVPLDDRTAGRWRSRIGWVPQSPHFFDASLGANLRLSAPDATPADLEAALRLARAEDVIARMPRGLQTRLGETGTGVSGGEARRLTLARAALSRPDVVLADEPTANLDAATAGAVCRGLLGLAARGATLIVATHDADLAARMDRRIDLGAGR